MPQPVNHIGIEWGSATYGPLLEAMSRNYRLVRFDNRGSGMSSRGLPEDFSILDYAIDLDCVLDTLGLHRAVLVGRITSASIAVKYALAHPERVEALVLWNPQLDYRDSFAHAHLELSRTHWEYFLATTGRAYFPLDDASIATEMARLSVERPDFAMRVQAATRLSIAADAEKLQLPALILAERIPNFPMVAEAQKLAASIPGARLRILDPFAATSSQDHDIPPAFTAISEFLTGLAGDDADRPHPLPRLSRRELEVLRLVASGRSNQEIADKLVISSNTVARHLSNVYDKTGAANRAEATAFASRNRLI